MIVCAKLSRELILAIVLVIKLFLDKCRCFVVLWTQLEVSCTDLSTCVVCVIAHFFFDS